MNAQQQTLWDDLRALAVEPRQPARAEQHPAGRRDRGPRISEWGQPVDHVRHARKAA